MKKKRDLSADYLRAIAMLLVVMGHTIANSNLTGYENSLLFKIIWALQMPLFMVVSGYVTFFAKPMASFHDLVKYIQKKSLTLLFPWGVWTIGVRGFLLGGWTAHNFLQKIIHLLWHMDSGYWFLTSLWSIQMLWGIAEFVCRKAFPGNALSKAFFTAAVTALLSSVLLITGFFAGFSFFGIKLSCYYLPFFLLGCVFPHFRSALSGKKGYALWERMLVCVLLIVFSFLLFSYNFYTAGDSVLTILMRIICSVSGCAVLAYCVHYLQSEHFRKEKTALLWIGSHTLELYLCHSLFLGIIDGGGAMLNSMAGTAVAIANFFITLLLSCAAAALLGWNRFTGLVFFGKFAVSNRAK